MTLNWSMSTKRWDGCVKPLSNDGIWDKALVILVADHGESLGDHGETSHGYFIYQSTMHVPLIIHWPAKAKIIRSESATAGGLIDVAPTILDFLHISAPPSFEGVSSLPGSRRTSQSYGERAYPLRNLRVG